MSSILDRVRKVTSAGWEGTPAAPGSRYNDISYEDKLIVKLRPTSILERVSMLSFVDNINCGYPKARMHEIGGQVQHLEEDGQLKPQENEYPCEEYMDIEYGLGSLRKLSKEQKEKFECNAGGYMDMLMMADMKEGRQVLEQVVLALIAAGAHHNNQGVGAGILSGQYNMGSPTNPITWTPDNAEMIFQNARMIFNEWYLEEGTGVSRPYGIIAPFMEQAFFNNDRIMSYYHQGNCVAACPRVNGAIEQSIYGFDMIKTPCLPTITVDGKKVYPIVFGYRDATEAVVQFQSINRDNPIVGDRSHFYEKYWDFGAKVWDGRKIAIAYVTPEAQ